MVSDGSVSGCSQVFQGDCGVIICLHVPCWLTTAQGLVVAGVVGYPCVKVLPGVAICGQAGVGACSV